MQDDLIFKYGISKLNCPGQEVNANKTKYFFKIKTKQNNNQSY